MPSTRPTEPDLDTTMLATIVVAYVDDDRVTVFDVPATDPVTGCVVGVLYLDGVDHSYLVSRHWAAYLDPGRSDQRRAAPVTVREVLWLAEVILGERLLAISPDIAA